MRELALPSKLQWHNLAIIAVTNHPRPPDCHIISETILWVHSSEVVPPPALHLLSLIAWPKSPQRRKTDIFHNHNTNNIDTAEVSQENSMLKGTQKLKECQIRMLFGISSIYEIWATGKVGPTFWGHQYIFSQFRLNSWTEQTYSHIDGILLRTLVSNFECMLHSSQNKHSDQHETHIRV